MNIGFIATRLAGTDGVSLEAAKLAAVYRQMGHLVFYCAGELDGTVPGLEAPELHFEDAIAKELHNRAFVARESAETLLPEINTRADTLKQPLNQFIDQFAIEYVVVQQVFAIPMQLPLAKAVTELLAERGLPALAHNHDYYWERDRFLNSDIGAYLDTYFPPKLPNVRHACINSLAQTALRERRNLDSILIPNVFDFETPPPGIDAYNADFRQAIGITDTDWLILQPTRVVPRKGIELAIELLAGLQDDRVKLVITHHAGDEGLDYLHALQAQAKAARVDLLYVAEQVDDMRHSAENGDKIYSLWDAYPHADLVTYTSLIEGFGNALIETVYFKVPAIVNRYTVYVDDIGPKGFQFVEIDGAVTDDAIAKVKRWLEQPQQTESIVAHNYQLGDQHYSYRTLRELLSAEMPV
jgi:glycosyltransferase involved in cell wall biosynthesis